MPVKIIVNADDLGISEPVNQAIFEGMRRGVLTSATILANGAAVKAAAQQVHSFPKCSFGIHLNLTEFAPLRESSDTDLAGILNENRCFNGNAIREIRIDRRMLRAVFREWCCQIETLMRLGVEPSHLDGHHHVHTIPQMLPVLAALRHRYKIRKIRISRNLYEDSLRPAGSLLAKKALFNLALRIIGFKTTRLFTDLATFLKLHSTHAPQSANVELMVHPGSPDSEEARLLQGYWPGQLAYEKELLSYNEL